MRTVSVMERPLKNGSMFQYSFEGTIESGKRKRITKGGYSTYEEAYQNGVKAKKSMINV